VPVETRDDATRVVLWRQLALGLVVFGGYLLVDATASVARRQAADRHGLEIYGLERHLHVDVEHWLNRLLAPHDVLSVAANYEYAWTYLVSALALFGWVLLRRPDLFRRVRDSFLVLNVAAIGCFAAYPLTPPRLLPQLGFVDTVTNGGTVGSWGTGMVDSANQLAAMPSLHFGWALWVSAVLARLTARRWLQAVSAVHVLVTFLVIVATANHYVLDAVAAAVMVSASVWVVDRWHDSPARNGLVVPTNDAFFLHVEETGAAQHVGGLVVFEAPEGLDARSSPTLQAVRDLVAGELPGLPRFRQQLAPRSRWLRPRWVDAGPIDWDWHVFECRSVHGRDGLDRVVAGLAEQPLPRDRPLWRIALVRDVGAGRSAFVILVHHAVADGIGTVIQAMSLLRPRVGLSGAGVAAPARWRLAVGTVTGIAQLAVDGRARGSLPAPSQRRAFASAQLPLDVVRRSALSRGVRTTDLILALVAEAVAATSPVLAARLDGRMRVAVPIMVRAPGSGPEGNATAAVMVEVPIGPQPFEQRLAEVARSTAPLRRPTRALASRFVMATGLRLLPEPWTAWFARTVYGRRFLHAVVSNMPGPSGRFTLAGAAMAQVYPILPLAPGAPLALGVLSWDGSLGVGVASDPEVLDATALAAHLETAVRDLELATTAADADERAGRPPSADGPHETEEQART
jgi:hypothetical protein